MARSTLQLPHRINNVSAYLPGLLTVERQPMSLQDHFYFASLFSTTLPNEVVVQAGRSVGKTQSVAGRIIFESALTPGHKTLIVTPLQEQSDTLSVTVFKPLVQESPIRLLLRSDTGGSVRRHDYANGSLIYFSYAFLDATRVRSKHVRWLYLDESYPGDTMISTPNGDRKITDLKPGDPVIAFDEKGQLHVDAVRSQSDHGTRDCYRLKLSDGTELEATSDSWIATTAGWKRVETIITDYADAAANAVAPGHDARRRKYASCDEVPDLHLTTRLDPARVQLPQVRGITRVRTHPTQEAEERRIRGLVQSVANSGNRSTAPYLVLVSPRQQEASHAGLVGPADLGGSRLVVHGRRFAVDAGVHVPHAGVHADGSRAAGRVVDCSRSRSEGRCTQVPPRSEQDLLDHPAQHRGIALPGREDSAVRVSGDALQTGAAGAADDADLRLVLEAVRAGKGLERDEADEHGQAVLRATGVSEGAAAGAREDGLRQSGAPRGQERVQPRVSGRTPESRSRGAARARPGAHAEVEDEESRLDEELRRQEDRGEGGRAQAAAVDVPTLPADGAAGRAGFADEILSGVQADRRCGDAGSDQRTCEAAEIVAIEWVGQQRVYDIETEVYHSFFANGVAVSNCQDLDPAFLPIIDSCLSHWHQPVTFKSGTSKTKDTTLYMAFEESSQGIWHVRCPRFPCDRDNICCVEGGHLLDMIGPYRSDISEQNPGLVCSKCRKPLNPRSGRWVHRRPELMDYRFGIHVPQPIVPIHYAVKEKWRTLLDKMAGRGSYTTGKFYNEVLGEAYDVAYKLFSIDDLKAAAQGIGPNEPDRAKARANRYVFVVLGVDWGGGGDDGVSRTKIAAAGMRPDGIAEVFYGAQFPPTMDSLTDARDVLAAAKLCKAKIIAHDYNGVGLPAEAAMTHFGWSPAQLAPMYYMANLSGDMVSFNQPAGNRARGFYVMDKGKTFKFLSMAVKALKVRFFDYDTANRDSPGLLNDFLCLVENLIEGTSRNTYTVRRRNKSDSDDFANAVNYATAALWEFTQTWPDLTQQGWSHGTPAGKR